MDKLNINADIKMMCDKIKNKGINRKLDDLGRIVIPKEYRNVIKCNPGSKVLMDFINDCVIITAVNDEEKIFSRKIDSLGRIVISKEFRELWSWKKDDFIRVSIYNSHLILRKFNNQCVFCYKEKCSFIYKDKYICNRCKENLIRNIKC